LTSESAFITTLNNLRLINTFGTLLNITNTNLINTSLTSGSAFITTLSNIRLINTFGTLLNITNSNMLITNELKAISSTNTIGTIFTVGGNVGINNTSPIQKLHINGDVMVNSIADTVSLTIMSDTIQNADFIQLQNSAGSSLIRADITGNLYTNVSYLVPTYTFFAEDLTSSSTTITTPLLKLRITTTSIPAGSYYVQYFADMSTNTANATFNISYRIDNVEQNLDRIRLSNNILNHFGNYFKISSLTTDVHTFEIFFFRTTPQTVTCNSARILVYRIS
jgi:hypothetical protein